MSNLESSPNTPWRRFPSAAAAFVLAVIAVVGTSHVRADTTLASGDSLSTETQACLVCHQSVTPGIVADWESSRHARTRVRVALEKPDDQRRISTAHPPKELLDNVVGCFECHSRNTGSHKDSFDHFGYRINVIVSPHDCATCHAVEVTQYEGSKKACAYGNLMDNPVYHALVSTVNGVKTVENDRIVNRDPSETTLNESCLGCHGSVVKVVGSDTVHSSLGDAVVPRLTNWPNQGVGRVNPDGSKGACTPCHARHAFSIAVARKPYTCAECHLEPDVPAWNVYSESKHGNIYFSSSNGWDMDAVPWTVGKDFQAPTCATCHNALLVAPDGSPIAERTHDFGSRLWVRIFGLIYTHPQPKSGDTRVIRNKDGLPLPTTFGGDIATSYLIDGAEQQKRLYAMEAVCQSCHATSWTEQHFAHLDTVSRETDEMTRTATGVVADAWKAGVEDKTNPFDEEIEKLWVEQWLFYANTTRYSAAMTGAPDYQAFKHGWWDMSANLVRMHDMLRLKKATMQKK